MKNVIKFGTNDFLPTLAMVNTIIAPKTTMPILADVRIETKRKDDGNVYAELMTSDGEIWLQAKTLLQEADEDGMCFCVAAKQLQQALGNLGDTIVTMSIDYDAHIVRCDYTNGFFVLPFDEATPYPMPLQDIEGAKVIITEASRLLNAIEKVRFCASNDELRQIMMSVHFDFLADGMVCVSTDAHRLAKYKDVTIKTETENDEAPMFTMPKKTCNAVVSALSNNQEGKVKMMFNGNYFSINNSDFKITSRLIDGNYPKYNAVIPNNHEKVVIVGKALLLSALKRVLPMGNISSDLVSMSFDTNMITILAKDEDYGTSAKENVPCDYAQEPFSIGFNGRLMLEMVKSIDGEMVKLLLNDETRPCLVKESKENTESEYTLLLMPMRL